MEDLKFNVKMVEELSFDGTKWPEIIRLLPADVVTPPAHMTVMKETLTIDVANGFATYRLDANWSGQYIGARLVAGHIYNTGDALIK